MDLLPTPGNPIPDGAVVTRCVARDGVGIRAAHWLPPGEARGTVLLMQGRAEFIEKYYEIVSDLLARGFAVATFDWRGQGGSDRQVRNPRKGHVRSFGHYVRDLDAVAEGVLAGMPRPHFALAHSMGGAIALSVARGGGAPFSRLVTTAPMIDLTIVRQVKLARGAATVLNLLGLGRSYVPGGGDTSLATKPFAGNPLTSDPVRYARNADAAATVGAGAIGDPTVAWVNAAFRHMNRLHEPRAPLEIRIPTLVLAAGADRVCSTRAAERFAARLKAGHAIVLPGARHEIMMERDAIREQFWAAFDAFIPGTPNPNWGRTDRKADSAAA